MSQTTDNINANTVAGSTPPQLQPLSYYLGLITSFNNKPNFLAVVQAITAPMQALAAFYENMLTAFDLDNSLGAQLDVVGQWIGRNRNVAAPLEGVYFSWSTSGLGWGQGQWKGAYDPSAGLVSLDDENYRTLLYAKQMANVWAGNNAGLPPILNTLFEDDIPNGTYVVVTDNQDMTMSVGIAGIVPNQVQLALLDGGYVPIKPEGVAIKYQVTSVEGAPLFAWGAPVSAPDGGNLMGSTLSNQQAALNGWGSSWGIDPSTANIVPSGNVWYAEAIIVGDGSLPTVASTLKNPYAYATINGTAVIGVQATSTTIWQASAVIAGVGEVATGSTAPTIWQASAAISAQGAVSTNASTIGYYATASIGGNGMLTATSNAVYAASAMIAGAASVTAAPAIGATTWNPADNANMTLSNSNLTATSGSSQSGVRSTSSRASGQYYAEFKITTSGAGARIGVANGNWSEVSALGSDGNSIALDQGGSVYTGNAATGGAMANWPSGVIGVAINIGSSTIDFTYNGTTWDSTGSASPEGAYSLTTLTGPFKLAFGAPGGTGGAAPNGSQGIGTNLFTNTAFTGGENGTTTLPSGFGLYGDTAITVTQVDTGTIDGMPYVDIKFSGTTSSTDIQLYITNSPTAYIATTASQATVGFMLSMSGGSLANISSVQVGADVNNLSTYWNFGSVTLTSTPVAVAWGGNNGSGAVGFSPNIKLNYASGEAINVTLRVAGFYAAASEVPFLYGPESITVAGTTQFAITGIQFADPNQSNEGGPITGGDCALNVSCNNGTLNYTYIVTNGSLSGGGTASTQIIDTFANIVADIPSLVYTANSGASSDVITVQLYDEYNLDNSFTIPVTVSTGGSSEVTLNVGEQAFAYSVPSGYSPWDAFAPAVVTGIVTNPASTSISVSWTAPAYGTVPITYTVQYRLSTSGIWINAASGITALSYEITGLATASTYEIQVIAGNVYGNATAPYVSATTTSNTGLPGDATGTQANRIADMMERFGVNMYPMTSYPGTNPGGSSGNYSVTGITTALGWLTANASGTAFGSGLATLNRLWESYQAEAGQINLQTLASEIVAGCPNGVHFTMTAGGNISNGDDSIPYNISFAEASHAGTSPLNGAAQYCMTLTEGYNEPNGIGGETIASAIAGQQEYSGSAVYGYSELTVLGPSITGGTPIWENYMSGYIDGSANQAALQACCQAWNVHYYPDHNPDFDDGSNRGGEFNDVYEGTNNAYGATKPQGITEWHPTEYNSTSSYIYNASYDSYYGALYVLSAFRLDYLCYTWWALYDYSSAYTGNGLWATDSTTSNPRNAAYVIRAMYALPGDTGSSTKHSFTTTKLNYSIGNWASPTAAGTSGTPAATSGSPNTGGQSMLFQNSSGTFALYVWNSQETPGGTADAVTITFAEAHTSLTEYNLTKNPTANLTPVQTLTNAESITIELAADVHVIVIEF